MSNPYPSIEDVEEIHDLIVSAGDEEAHYENYPHCTCMKEPPETQPLPKHMVDYARSIVKQLNREKK